MSARFTDQFDEIKVALEGMNEAHEVWRKTEGERIGRIEKTLAGVVDRVEEAESKAASPGRPGSRPGGAEAKALETFVRHGDRTQLDALPERKEMSIAGGASAGGALVPEIIANEIISRAIALSPLAGLVRLTPTDSSDYVRLLNLRGATAAWSSETGTRNATATPELREIRPTSGELYALPGFTRWLAEDSKFDVTAFVRENVSDVFAKSLENAILFGDGSSKPTGLLDSSPVTTPDDASPLRDADTIQYVAGTADLADDLISLYFSLKPEYRRAATFVMSSATLSTVRKLRDSNGSGYLWQANLGAGVDASDGTLLGKRVITTEELPVVGASPAVDSILCGDFNVGYELVRIGPMVIVRDDVTTKGKIILYIAQRFGGRLVDNDAVKVLRG